MRSLDEVLEVLEREAGSPYAKKIRCRLCGDVIFELAPRAPQNEVNAEMVRLSAHLSIQHQITVDYHQCSDPNCVD